MKIFRLTQDPERYAELLKKLVESGNEKQCSLRKLPTIPLGATARVIWVKGRTKDGKEIGYWFQICYRDAAGHIHQC